MGVRQMRPEDVGEVIRLLRQLWPDKQLDPAALEQVFSRILGSEQWRCLCAEQYGRVVGFTSVMVRDSIWQEGLVAYAEVLVVDEAARGQGIGTALINAGIAWARSRGCKLFEMDSALHRTRAHALYEKLGFAKRGFAFTKEL